MPVAVVADRRPDGRIEELRVYFTGQPLTGRAVTRPPLLQPEPGLVVPDARRDVPDARALVGGLEPTVGAALETCALVDDGRACALEYNVVRPGHGAARREAGRGLRPRARSGGLAAVRVYDDSRRSLSRPA